MKVIHLVPSMESGGVEQVVLELGKAYSSQGIDNIVISSGGRLVDQLVAQGSRHIPLPIGKKSLLTFFQIGKLARVLREEKPDILHIHSRVPAWVGFPARQRLLRDFLIPVVTTVHGFYSVNFYSAIMAKGDRVIAVSECIKDYILKNYPSTRPDAIRVIPNSINPAEYHPGYTPPAEWLTQWRRDYPELEGKLTLCLPGRLTRIKGQADLAPILAELKRQEIPAHAVIVGEAKKGKEAYKQELLDLYRQAGVEHLVTWTGHRSDLKNILSACDITLSLSTAPESFGKSTLEALALGKPVIGYAHGGVKEQLERIFPGGLIPVGDRASAAAKLAEWYRAAPPVPGLIPEDYRFDGMISHHLAVYRELLETQTAVN